MAVPARRTSKMRKNTRRSHHGLAAPTTTNCQSCGSVALPHHACMKCKTYKGMSIAPDKKVTDKKTSVKDQKTENKKIKK